MTADITHTHTQQRSVHKIPNVYIGRRPQRPKSTYEYSLVSSLPCSLRLHAVYASHRIQHTQDARQRAASQGIRFRPVGANLMRHSIKKFPDPDSVSQRHSFGWFVKVRRISDQNGLDQPVKCSLNLNPISLWNWQICQTEIPIRL